MPRPAPSSDRPQGRPREIAAAVIEEQKKAEQTLRAANAKMEHAWMVARQVFDMNSSPLVVIDEWEKMVIANPAFLKLMDIPPDEVEGREVSARTNRIPEPTRLMEEGLDFATVQFEIKTPEGNRPLSASGRIIRQGAEHPGRILLQFSETPLEDRR
jgi:PAS domain-containing protein